jgi:hypothetical protein
MNKLTSFIETNTANYKINAAFVPAQPPFSDVEKLHTNEVKWMFLRKHVIACLVSHYMFIHERVPLYMLLDILQKTKHHVLNKARVLSRISLELLLVDLLHIGSHALLHHKRDACWTKLVQHNELVGYTKAELNDDIRSLFVNFRERSEYASYPDEVQQRVVTLTRKNYTKFDVELTQFDAWVAANYNKLIKSSGYNDKEICTIRDEHLYPHVGETFDRWSLRLTDSTAEIADLEIQYNNLAVYRDYKLLTLYCRALRDANETVMTNNMALTSEHSVANLELEVARYALCHDLKFDHNLDNVEIDLGALEANLITYYTKVLERDMFRYSGSFLKTFRIDDRRAIHKFLSVFKRDK